MRATAQKMTRCGWAKCCLHKIKLRFVELDYCYFKYEIRSVGLPSEVFFSSHSSDISVVFCQGTAADETASLAVASKVSVASSVEAAF